MITKERLMRTAERAAWHTGWQFRHWRWIACMLATAGLTEMAGHRVPALLLVLVALLPGVVACWWQGTHPGGYERFAVAPWRRLGWRWKIRRTWSKVARKCGLCEPEHLSRTDAKGRLRHETRWIAPNLKKVRARDHSVELVIRARDGQTVTELENGAERLASTWDAHTFRHWVDVKKPSSTLHVELVMHEVLTTATVAVEPEPRALYESVRLGKTQAGRMWDLLLRSESTGVRHVLTVGASGSGKSGILWGICGGLAPAVRADVVRLWGIDLKRGVELGMGRGLFSTVAYTPRDALTLLRRLRRVIDQRGRQMSGVARLHVPTVGDPMHVLVIDELAVLTAYADYEVRRDAERLLSEILTQGRALGVLVVGFVQDPRKEVINMRGLFTQTIALRLRTTDEVIATLGDGMHRVAPAHRINPDHPGIGWIVEDSGAVDRVRSDLWPDALVRDLATRYATQAPADTDDADESGEFADLVDVLDLVKSERAGERKPRKPRKPRNRQTKTPPTQPGTELDVVDEVVVEPVVVEGTVVDTGDPEPVR